MKNTIARRLCVSDVMTFVPAWHAVDVRQSAIAVRFRAAVASDAAVTRAYGAAAGTTTAATTTTKPSTTPVASSASSPPV